MQLLTSLLIIFRKLNDNVILWEESDDALFELAVQLFTGKFGVATPKCFNQMSIENFYLTAKTYIPLIRFL